MIVIWYASQWFGGCACMQGAFAGLMSTLATVVIATAMVTRCLRKRLTPPDLIWHPLFQLVLILAILGIHLLAH